MSDITRQQTNNNNNNKKVELCGPLFICSLSLLFFATLSVVLLLSFTQVQDVTIKSWAFAVSVVAEVSIVPLCYYRYL